MSSIRLLTGLTLFLIMAAYAMLLLVAAAALALVYRASREEAPQRAALALRHLRGAALALGLTILAEAGLIYAIDFLRDPEILMLVVMLERPWLLFEGDGVTFVWALVVATAWGLAARPRQSAIPA